MKNKTEITAHFDDGTTKLITRSGGYTFSEDEAKAWYIGRKFRVQDWPSDNHSTTVCTKIEHKNFSEPVEPRPTPISVKLVSNNCCIWMGCDVCGDGFDPDMICGMANGKYWMCYECLSLWAPLTFHWFRVSWQHGKEDDYDVRHNHCLHGQQDWTEEKAAEWDRNNPTEEGENNWLAHPEHIPSKSAAPSLAWLNYREKKSKK